MSNFPFKGVGVAIVTPFKEDHNIDFDSLENLTHTIIEGGADYIVALGTTGESPTLSRKEKQDICKTVVNVCEGKIPIVIGIGSNDTSKVCKRISEADLTNIAAILSVVPYYNKPSQEGIYRHFEEIAKISPLPLILYNIPGRTGVNMQAETTIRLARDFKNISAIKEASGNFQQIKEIINNKPTGFEVISGDDAMTVSIMEMGACGVISVTANLYPSAIGKLTDLCRHGKNNEYLKLNSELTRLYTLLFAEGNPAGIKCALSLKNLIKNELRLPLTPVSKTLEKEIATEIERLDALLQEL